MINTGEVNNQADLAKIKGISRARITQILNLLKLDKSIIDKLEKLGDPIKSEIITERMLRPYVNKSPQEQKTLLNIW
jgi:DNA repair protein RadC